MKINEQATSKENTVGHDTSLMNLFVFIVITSITVNTANSRLPGLSRKIHLSSHAICHF